MPKILTLAGLTALCFELTGSSLAAPSSAVVTTAARVHTESLVALLDLLDAVARANPDSQSVCANLAKLEPGPRRERLARLTARNAADTTIASRLAAWLDSPARTIYFHRFQNVGPEHAQAAILALPYESVAAPGDLATAWYELFPRRDAVRARVRQLADSIDLARCAALAQLWLPPGEYTLPKLDLIWDSNAGSYVAEGRAFYNLYQGEGATCLQGDDAERVIAHELHHILAEPLRANRIEWRTEARHKSMRRVIRQMVSEGSALHCNAPAGFKAELWNDPGVKAALVADLQRTFLALDAGTMGEDRFRAWFDDSYHGRALAILEDFAHRRGDADPVALARTHAVDRPDLVHALGWWMVQTVSRGGQDPAAVHALVREPDWLLARYDAALTDSDPRLRLDPRVTQMAGH